MSSIKMSENEMDTFSSLTPNPPSPVDPVISREQKRKSSIPMQFLDRLRKSSNANDNVSVDMHSGFKREKSVVNKELLLSLVKEKARKRRVYKELFLHLFFFVIFLVILFLQRDVFSNYLMNNAIANSIITQDIDEQFSFFRKNFMSVGQWDEMADYIQGNLVPALVSQQGYGQLNSSKPPGIVQYNNFLVGGIRFRQLRVRDDSCKAHPDFLYLSGGSCFAKSYDDDTRDTADFVGPYSGTTYKFQNSHQSNSVRILGHTGGWYPGEGFIVDIPVNENIGNEINNIVSDEWWGLSTRAIIISMVFANPNLDNRLNHLSLVFELDAGGGVNPFYEFKPFRVHLYVDALDWFRMALELLFVVILIFQIGVEVFEAYTCYKETGAFWGYILSVWNLVEVGNLVLFVISASMYIRYISLPHVDLRLPYYNPTLEYLAAQALDFYNLSAFNILLSAFKTFKFLKLNDRLYLLWRTLDMAWTDLTGFLLIFIIVLLGFLLTGWVTFGSDTFFFSTFVNSFGTCWQFIIGNPPDYNAMYASNRVLGPAFFALFTVFVFFILVNMFIAIINDSYQEAHDGSQKLRVGYAIKSSIRGLFHSVKAIFRGEKTLSDRELINMLTHPEIMNQDELTTEDAVRALGENLSWNKHYIRRLKTIHAKAKHIADDPEALQRKLSTTSLRSREKKKRASIPESFSVDNMDAMRSQLDSLEYKMQQLMTMMENLEKRT
eukprot:TRINITY_DN1611_c1_g1_i1.p1 TRINITY_DN1611_c1_g1~~TRINITY_DN1611_c1_g1_i1.p1  ORF type:complete len:721 (-),score=128.88 TRINITY_DN1611_c1_g1_i1:40-2202(-)